MAKIILAGKTALVTGGSRGIGRAIALELAHNGARVAVNYRTGEGPALELVEEIRQGGGEAIALKADVSSFSEAAGLVEKTIDYFQKIDIIVNNAGITSDDLVVRMSEEKWREVLTVDLDGVFFITRAALKPMIKQRSGRIINLTSVVGLGGNAGQANYAAAKAGVIGFTKSLAKEVASRSILVNAIAPGYISTDMTSGLQGKNQERLLESIPLGRLGNPEDVAGVVVFLASPAASYITGQVLRVDGGMNV